MPLIRYRGRLLLLAAIIAVAWVLWPRTSAVGQPSGPETIRPTEVKYHGAGSCSSMACHNFNGPEGDFRSEYSTWANGDKHSRAFTVLYNERSNQIMKNLRGNTTPGSATEDRLCLKCHATNNGSTADVGERFALADGVGCEACHGPSQKYLTTHYHTGFEDLTPEEKEQQYGLKNTKNLVKRAELCITCHVGNETKEVNHDLYGAGHPRLNFELAGYHGIAHKHWSDEKERARVKDYYARLWLIGQLVSSRSALELLAVRAETANEGNPEKRRPWPEFAEYACYACHKDLKVTDLSTKSAHHEYYSKKANLGSLPYGNWYLSALPQLTGDPGYISDSVIKDIKTVREVMERPGIFSKADTDGIAKEARAAAKTLQAALDRFAGSKELEPAQLNALVRHYVDDGLKRADTMTWDEATQMYLAVAALTQDLATGPSPVLIPGKGREQLVALKERLKESFPKHDDSPRYYSPGAMTLPNKKTFPPLADQLKAIRTQLGN